MARSRAAAENEFASRLDEAMHAAGVTQNVLERAIGGAQGTVSKMRTRGAQRIEPDTLFAIADTLKVEARWLFTGRGGRDRASAPTAAETADIARLRERIAHLEEALHAIETTCRGAIRRARP